MWNYSYVLSLNTPLHAGAPGVVSGAEGATGAGAWQPAGDPELLARARGEAVHVHMFRLTLCC